MIGDQQINESVHLSNLDLVMDGTLKFVSHMDRNIGTYYSIAETVI